MRAAFAAQALFAVAVLTATLAWLAETNRQRDAAATRPRVLATNYAFLLRSREFLAYTLVSSASYGGLFAFISGSSPVLIRVLGVPTANFGFAFAFCVCGYLAGTIHCRRLLSRSSVPRALRTGAGLALASGTAMTGLAIAGVHHWAALIGPAFVYFFAHGINFPCGQAGSVAPFSRHAGAAAGLFGFLVMAFASMTGAWIGATYNGTVYPLALTMAACSAVTFTTVFGWVARLRATAVATASVDPGV